MKKILISEIFGITIQGEGALIGKPTVFVRVGGCDFRCDWCIAPETPILMGDWTELVAEEIRAGDEIIGMTRRSQVPEAVGKYQAGIVEDVTRRQTRVLKLTFNDGREISVAEEHAFTLFKTGRFIKANQLTPEHKLRALPRWDSWRECADYRAGYLAGAADGDGSFHRKVQPGIWHFVIATADDEILERFFQYACAAGFELNRGKHLSGGDFAPARHINCLRLTRTLEAQRLRAFLQEYPRTLEFHRGYFAGIYDTDGSSDGKTISIMQFKIGIREKIEDCLKALQLDYSQSTKGFRLRGGHAVSRRILMETKPALKRKTRAHFQSHGGVDEFIQLTSVEDLGMKEVVSIKTSLGTYVANGMLSRNCDTLYAVLPEFKNEWTPMSAAEIVAGVLALTNGQPILVTLSGGNPALHDLEPLIALGRESGLSFNLETQGSKARAWFSKLDFLTLSPKGPSSKMKTDWDALQKCVEFANATGERSTQVSLKIVVFDDADYDFAREASTRFPDVPMILQIGSDAPVDGEIDNDKIRQKTEWLLEKVTRDGWLKVTILPQLHVLLWGSKRGV